MVGLTTTLAARDAEMQAERDALREREKARVESIDDAVRALRARYDLLRADALARQRGVYLDGSPRRETVPVPADPMAQPFTPVKLGAGTGSTSADPARQGLVAALNEIGALASPIAEQGQDADELRRRIYHALALARAEDER